MKDGFDKLLETAGRVVDSAAKKTGDLVDKGKDKMEIYSLQAKLSKAERQLGALVYMLRKTGQENEPMVKHYVDEIDVAKARIADLSGTGGAPAASGVCASCGEEGQEGAMFCRRCGAKLYDTQSGNFDDNR